MNTESFEIRHIGPRKKEIEKMLSLINANSIDELIDQTIPESIRNRNEMKLDPPMSESDYLTHLKKISSLNKVYKTYIGMGYNRSYLPAVIQRNILENPGWYTAYTPYQAEIAQGRLEALLNFQTMVTDLTGMEISNASLLDESTAAAEAMTLLFSTRSREQKKENVNSFFVSIDTFPQTLALLETRAKPLGINLEIAELSKFDTEKKYTAYLVRYSASSQAESPPPITASCSFLN